MPPRRGLCVVLLQLLQLLSGGAAPVVHQVQLLCCSRSPLAIAVVLQQLQLVSCCSSYAAAHCTPVPTWGLWGAASAARQLLPSYCSCSSSLHAAAPMLQLTAANPHHVTNPGAMGVLLLHPFSSCCSFHAAASLTQLTAAYPRPVTNQGAMGALPTTLFTCTARGFLMACTACAGVSPPQVPAAPCGLGEQCEEDVPQS